MNSQVLSVNSQVLQKAIYWSAWWYFAININVVAGLDYIPATQRQHRFDPPHPPQHQHTFKPPKGYKFHPPVGKTLPKRWHQEMPKRFKKPRKTDQPGVYDKNPVPNSGYDKWKKTVRDWYRQNQIGKISGNQNNQKKTPAPKFIFG